MKSSEELNIFLVDDDPLFLKVLEHDIRHFFANVNIRTFLTGEECLKDIPEHPDAVILDYFLPGMNGLTTFLKIKEKNPDVPVVILSGNGNVKMMQQLFSEGVYDYVIKGSDYIQELRFSISEIITGKNKKTESFILDNDMSNVLIIGVIILITIVLAWAFLILRTN